MPDGVVKLSTCSDGKPLYPPDVPEGLFLIDWGSFWELIPFRFSKHAMSSSLRPFLCAAVCAPFLLCASCLPMPGTGQMLAGSRLADGLLSSSSSLDLVWRGDISSFPSSGLETPRGFKVSPADSYSLLMEARPGISGEWACYHDRTSYYWSFVAGKAEEEAGLYAVRHGVAVNGVNAEVDAHPAVQAPSVM